MHLVYHKVIHNCWPSHASLPSWHKHCDHVVCHTKTATHEWSRICNTILHKCSKMQHFCLQWTPLGDYRHVTYRTFLDSSRWADIRLQDKVRYWSKIVSFSYPLTFDALVMGGLHRNISILWCGKTRMVGLPNGEKTFEDIYNGLDQIAACDRQTDGQTSCHGIVRTMHTRCMVKIDIADEIYNKMHIVFVG